MSGTTPARGTCLSCKICDGATRHVFALPAMRSTGVKRRHDSGRLRLDGIVLLRIGARPEAASGMQRMARAARGRHRAAAVRPGLSRAAASKRLTGPLQSA